MMTDGFVLEPQDEAPSLTQRETPMVFADADRGGIIHVANIKGGVGKSTLATNLAASLSGKGSTLLIDLDVQGSASVALGVDARERERTAFDLFKRKYSARPPLSHYLQTLDISGAVAKLEETALRGIRRYGSIEDIIVKAGTDLHVAPAGVGLFNTPSGQQFANFLHNLNILRARYKYIVVDTPSVWNKLTRTLYVNSDLNLIPVTLDALSTNSLREYLTHVKKLIARNPHVRLRVVKNEVVGENDMRAGGKTRTISTNRRFLYSLCEQAAARSSGGVALLPKSIMFDLEIPESTVIREAQDAGVPVHCHENGAEAAAAFDHLAKNVQYVLNGIYRENITAAAIEDRVIFAFKVAAAAAVIAIVSMNKPVNDTAPAPHPIAPQQLAITQTQEDVQFTHTFRSGDQAARLAKHAISRFSGVVPTQREVYAYLMETINIHNTTRHPNEPKINSAESIPAGTTLTFYRPTKISNKNERALVPAYKFFMDMVNDPYPYITGDWCERGTGGGRPHYGIDVAAPYGSEVITPVDGKAVWRSNENGGTMVGVQFDNSIIVFMHLDKRLVKDGEYVKKGTPIGTIGMTGRTTGPHVHVEYGITSQSRHDMTFGNKNYRVTDPKYLFYKMAYMDFASM